MRLYVPEYSMLQTIHTANVTFVQHNAVHIYRDTDMSINLLKPTGHVMHQEFNIQQLYVLPTLCLCVLYLSENKQRLVPLTA